MKWHQSIHLIKEIKEQPCAVVNSALSRALELSTELATIWITQITANLVPFINDLFPPVYSDGMIPFIYFEYLSHSKYCLLEILLSFFLEDSMIIWCWRVNSGVHKLKKGFVWTPSIFYLITFLQKKEALPSLYVANLK